MADLTRIEAIIDIFIGNGRDAVEAAGIADALMALSREQWRYLKAVRDSSAVKFSVSTPAKDANGKAARGGL